VNVRQIVFAGKRAPTVGVACKRFITRLTPLITTLPARR
jgi:hypothetical protein